MFVVHLDLLFCKLWSVFISFPIFLLGSYWLLLLICKSYLFILKIFIYLAAPSLCCRTQDLQLRHANSLLQHVECSSLTRDRTQAPCIWSAESQPLDHQGSPCKSSLNIFILILHHIYVLQISSSLCLAFFLTYDFHTEVKFFNVKSIRFFFPLCSLSFLSLVLETFPYLEVIYSSIQSSNMFNFVFSQFSL